MVNLSKSSTRLLLDDGEKETLGSFGTLREQLTLLKEKEEREEECKGLLTSSGKTRKEDILCRLLDCKISEVWLLWFRKSVE